MKKNSRQDRELCSAVIAHRDIKAAWLVASGWVWIECDSDRIEACSELGKGDGDGRIDRIPS